jgi:hypothetical protein
MSRLPLSSIFKKLPGVRAVVQERDTLRRDVGFVPPGHFYSPIPAFGDVERESDRLFGQVPRTIPGIDLRESDQLALLESFVPFYAEQPFPAEKTTKHRYYFKNPAYSYSDAIMLHCMIRHLQPKRIVEIGSGYSSCVTLDTNELFFDNQIETTFIEPYPKLLESLVSEDDKRRIRIIPERLQDVDEREFASLGPNDILFVDSTHVAKIGSDVNRVFHDILPALAGGVYIHIHDVFYPFEYPKEWLLEGRAWNEIYMLRAFLEYNARFEIVLMNTFLQEFHEEFFQEKMPLCLRNKGGSIWLRKK